MVRRRRADTAAARATLAALSCRPRRAIATISTVTAVTAIAVITEISEITGDPTTITGVTVTAISVITAATRRSRRSNGRDNSDCNGGYIDHRGHGDHCGPYRGRGWIADAGRPCGTVCQCLALPAAAGPLVCRWLRLPPPLARRSPLPWPAGPPDYQPPLTRRSAAVAAAAGRCGSKRCSLLMRQEPDDRASQCSHAAGAAVAGPFTSDGELQPGRDCMLCHEAVGPSSRCWLGRPILAASLPDIRSLAIRVGRLSCRRRCE